MRTALGFGLSLPASPVAGSGGGAPYVGPLDAYQSLTGCTLWAATSFNKKLLSAYAGNARTTRRASDSTTTPVAFLTNGNADFASEVAFCAGGLGLVTVTNDHTGNGRNFAQATPAAQPRTLTTGGVPQPYGYEYNASTESLNGAVNTPSVAAITVFMKFRQESLLAGTQIYIEHTANVNNADGFYVAWTAGVLRVLLARNLASVGVVKDYPIATVDGGVLCFRLDTSEVGLNRVKVYKAGVLQTPSAQSDTGGSGNFAADKFYVGSRGGTSLFATIIVQQLAIYTGATGPTDAEIASVSAALA